MSELDTAIRHFRSLRTKREASVARALQDAFERASNGLQAQLDGMVAWLDANPNPPLWRVLAEARTRNLLMQAESLFNQYSREVGDTIHREQAVAVAQAQHDARDLIAKGFGTPPIGVGLPFVALPQQAIGQLTATLQPGAPVRKLLDEFGGDAASIVESELITGVASGRSPRQTARAISDAVGGQYDRALLITRTETLRAYRGAQQALYEENSHLLEGWIWHASLSTRTCASCWAMHGTLHSVAETMSEHPAGRCSMIPRTKSWKGLGYDVPDTRPNIEPGVDVFNRLAPADQQLILGPKAYTAFRDGSIELTDLVHVHQSRTWGETRSVGSVEGALSRAGRRAGATTPTAKTFSPAKDLKTWQRHIQDLGIEPRIDLPKKRWTAEQKQAQLNAANAMTEGFQKMQALGLKMPKVARLNWDTGNNLAWFTPGDSTGSINVNVIHRLWSKPIAESARMHREGWLTTEHPHEIFIHEFGHWQDYQNGGPQARAKSFETHSQFLRDMRRKLTPEEEQIAATISRYAKTDRGEFMAETFARVATGRAVPKDALDLYRKLGGWERT